MEPSSQCKSWKRAIDLHDNEEPHDTRSKQTSKQEDLPESKRARSGTDDEAQNGSAGQTSSFPLPEPSPFATGHSYGPSTVRGNACLQNGDSYYSAGPSSQIWGPGVLNGDMRVQLSNVFHTYNYGLLNSDTKDVQEQGMFAHHDLSVD